MNILITGISGFVGNNLVEYFSNIKGCCIYGLDITFDDIKGVKKIYSWSDMTSIENIDVVIHLAGKAHDLKNISDEQSYFDINYGLSKKIFDWYLNSSATKFFMMSSVKAVADIVDGILCEDVIPAPATAYGRSKQKAEEYLNSINLPSDKKLYIFRPAMIHGPGNKGNLNLLYSVVSKRIPWPLAAFENKRSFVSIDNLCFVFKRLIEKDILSGTYNVADDDSVSTNELVSIISETLGHKAKLWHLPKSLIVLSAKIGGMFKLPLNTERLNKLTESYIVSNLKLKSVLNENLPVSAEKGLAKAIESFKLDKSK